MAPVLGSARWTRLKSQEAARTTEPLEMVVAGRDLKTDTFQTEGAVGSALGANSLRR